jgi:hypothetical protein
MRFMNYPRRVLPDGRTLEAIPLLFGGRLTLTVNPEDVGQCYDDAW